MPSSTAHPTLSCLATLDPLNERFTTVSTEDMTALCQAYQNGQRHERYRIIVYNLRLIIKITHRYHLNAYDFDDAVQEGILGLLEALEHFDPDKGFALSTYATWWIHKSIQKFLHRNRSSVRLPVNILDDIHRLTQIETQWTQTHTSEPRPEDLAPILGWPLNKVSNLLMWAQPMLSLDNPTNAENSKEQWIDQLADTQSETPETALLEKEYQTTVEQLLSILTPKERQVLTLRYGLANQTESQWNTIVQTMKISRPTAIKIATHAIKRLRHHPLNSTFRIPAAQRKINK